ncbi:gamma-glutamyl-gamma-aminobutyrate hydrolase family protein [Maribellus sp. YY47]|uniref:gamma-glutamyl-gamma-aminobutyrate hydrolase family protein n=1 Tax=Maribellus sp. YY47 TaxID=2929486 RepID=UPI002000F903|nr:gamma-glutamyl-gamma-aminobutyrate hydrolase family protein [Maribellus sp. YY47]MCK3684196.1 gamma-glutamyl-gamma-aminobutyrate hydrolase family protein [Maribellus sp. YY47]
MQKIIFSILLVLFTLGSYSQTFFDQNFDKNKRYVLLCDPTISRIQTIRYLTENKIFKIPRNVEFVGVYFEEQHYDFAKTKQYLEENQLNNFHLQAVKGDLKAENLYEKNEISGQLKKVFDHSVGVIFFGGPDIPPGIYGEENTLSVVTDPERHYYETTFLFQLLGGYQNENFRPFLTERPDYLVTGFCLGMQTMNVATGGTLVQDIPAELYRAETPEQKVKVSRENLHRNYWQELHDDSLLMGINLHPIQFTENDFFGKAVKVKKNEKPKILSAHHQAAEKIGKNMEVTALSEDGKIVEGIVHKVYPNVFAVQFHPEVAALYEDREALKFSPADEAQTYPAIIGKEGLRFHKAYWKHISKALKQVKQ